MSLVTDATVGLKQVEVLVDADLIQPYLQDASGQSAQTVVSQVFRPKNTQELAAVVKSCHEQGKKICVQGGLTGLAGGAVPSADEVVINLSRMNQVIDFDTVGGMIRVQPGMVLQQLCEYVEQQGWYFPMDMGARGSCHIGGNVATNAGGNRVLRYGTMRELVLGLEVVLADGTIMPMLNYGLKNNTGVDLKHLFIGSEGTLGIISQVVLRLFPLPERRYSALVALTGFEQVVELLRRARGQLAELSSFELMWKSYLQAAADQLKTQAPFNAEYPVYVLLEMEGKDDPETEALLTQFLEQSLEDELAVDVILPHSQDQARQLWDLRDAIGEILPTMKPYLAFDVGIPIAQANDFVKKMEQSLSQRYPGSKQLFFGHLGDGNLHLSTGPHEASTLEEVEHVVYQAVAELGGSISAEHGIGRIKKPFLHYSRNEIERKQMQALRQLFDPNDLLNSGRVIDNN